MATLDEYFGIFSEGQNDAVYRKRGLQVYDRFAKALKTVDTKDIKGFRGAGGFPAASINVGVLNKDIDLIDLNISFQTRPASWKKTTLGMFSTRSGKKEKYITFYVNVKDVQLKDLNFTKWAEILKSKKLAEKFFDDGKETFWHEFIHYMDHARMSPDQRKKAFSGYKSPSHTAAEREKSGKPLSDKEKEKVRYNYTNNPIETNAFIQQGLSRIEYHLKDLDNKEDIQAIIGKHPNDLYKLVKAVVYKSFGKNLSDSNVAKLKKRTAQMWLDNMKRFDGREKK
jgi:hypothetical protein